MRRVEHGNSMMERATRPTRTNGTGITCSHVCERATRPPARDVWPRRTIGAVGEFQVFPLCKARHEELRQVEALETEVLKHP